MLEKPPVGLDLLAPNAVPDSHPRGPSPAANSMNRAPFVLMHMPKWWKQTRYVAPVPTTALDDFHTPVDAPSTGTLTPGSEITPERPESPEEVTGLIERFAGAAINSDGGTGAGEGESGAAASGGAAACAQCGIRDVELKRCVRCWQVAYCGKE